MKRRIRPALTAKGEAQLRRVVARQLRQYDKLHKAVVNTEWVAMLLGALDAERAAHAKTRRELAGARAERDALRTQLATARREKDRAYHERNLLVAFLARLYPAHFKRHPDSDTTWESDWRTIICVHGPCGQMTWHVHDSEAVLFGFLNRAPDPFAACVWDGHSTDEKYRRLLDIGAAAIRRLDDEEKDRG